jgi:hypothetical protein
VVEEEARTERQNPPPPMVVPREDVVAFALYTVDAGALKMTAQLYPLKPEEPREARLEVERDGKWVELLKAPVLAPGWSAHFRVEKWDVSKSVKYPNNLPAVHTAYTDLRSLSSTAAAGGTHRG